MNHLSFPYEKRTLTCEFDIGQEIEYFYLGTCPNYVWGGGGGKEFNFQAIAVGNQCN